MQYIFRCFIQKVVEKSQKVVALSHYYFATNKLRKIHGTNKLKKAFSAIFFTVIMARRMPFFNRNIQFLNAGSPDSFGAFNLSRIGQRCVPFNLSTHVLIAGCATSSNAARNTYTYPVIME